MAALPARGTKDRHKSEMPRRPESRDGADLGGRDATEEPCARRPGLILIRLDRRGIILLAEGTGLGAMGFDHGELEGRRLAEVFADCHALLSGAQEAIRGEAGATMISLRGVPLDVTFEPLPPTREAGALIVARPPPSPEPSVLPEVRALLEHLPGLAETQQVAHVGSFEWDLRSDRIVWSDELCRLYGVEPGEFDGSFDEYLAVVHPDDRRMVDRSARKILRDLGPFANDFRIVRADGTVRTIRNQGDVIRDSAGQAVRVVGSAWDVTEITEAMEQLRRSVSLLRATLEATDDGILVVDRSGRITGHNERFRELWQVPCELAESRNDDRLLAHMHAQLSTPDPTWGCGSTSALYSPSTSDRHDLLWLKDGRVFERYSKTQQLSGQVLGQVWIFRDVTEREVVLRRTKLLSDATRLLTTLDVERALEGVAHMVVPFLGQRCAIDLLDEGRPRRLVSVNTSGAPTGDPKTGSFEGTEGLRLDEATAAHFRALSERCLGQQDPTRLEVPLIVEKRLVGVMSLLAPSDFTYGDDDLELVEELGRRMALTIENARLYQAAQDALHARDELFAVAAHEIRGPLMSLHLAVQSLMNGVGTPADHQKLLSIIERDDRRLSRLIDELLDVCRLRAGRLQLELERVDLASVVHEVISWLGREGSERRSPVLVHTEGPVVGHWDRFRLDQVVQNLVSNALKFGEGRPVEVTVRGDAARATLVVKDHGAGIPGERKEAIFQPFEQGVSTRQYGGLGLGLHIVRTIVHALDGYIRVESEPGRGAAFIVELPRRPTSVSSEASGASRTGPGTFRGSGDR